MLTALALATASSFALLVFVHHASQQLRVSALVDLVGDELRAQRERRFQPSRTCARTRRCCCRATPAT